MQVVRDIVNQNLVFNVVDKCPDRNARMTFKGGGFMELMHNSRNGVLMLVVSHVGVVGCTGDG